MMRQVQMFSHKPWPGAAICSASNTLVDAMTREVATWTSTARHRRKAMRLYATCPTCGCSTLCVEVAPIARQVACQVAGCTAPATHEIRFPLGLHYYCEADAGRAHRQVAQPHTVPKKRSESE